MRLHIDVHKVHSERYRSKILLDANEMRHTMLQTHIDWIQTEIFAIALSAALNHQLATSIKSEFN